MVEKSVEVNTIKYNIFVSIKTSNAFWSCNLTSSFTFCLVNKIKSYIQKIVYYVPTHIMKVITRGATMLAGDRSQGIVEA